MARQHSSEPQPTLLRRVMPALVLTGASGLLLNALDRPGGVAGADASGTTDTAVTLGTVVIATTAPATSTTSATVPATEATTAATTASTTAATTAATTVATAGVDSTVPTAPTCTTVTGPTVSTRYGPVQVQATVSADGQLCTVDAIVTPTRDGKSVRINNRAVPILDSSALSAQSANFQGVSGATYTSSAYQQSLQAILDAVA